MSCKPILFLSLLFTVNVALAQNPKPVPVIFDTNIVSDYDDVSSVTLLNAFADNGEATISAAISSNAFPTTTPAVSIIDGPEVPIEMLKNC